jgi:glycosyltransferase involved in cell wall biosynthesis
LATPENGIQVTGYVDDPTPYLERAALMVVPLRAASGMRVKILTALAQGLPVVSTTVGCEGIAVEPGVHLLVADEPAAFAAATLRLLNDRAEADRLAANGRRLVTQRYDYRQVYAPLEQVYERAGQPRAAARRMRA